MKRVLSFVLVIVLLVGILPAQVFAAEPMTYRGVTDNVNGNGYTVFNSSGGSEIFSYSVPKDGATVLIFFSALCGNSMSLFSQLEECVWLDNPYVNIVAVESKTQNTDDLDTFCDYCIPTRRDCVDFFYSSNRLMWDYFWQISSEYSLTYPVVFVITENGSGRIIEYGDMMMTSAGSLYKTLCAVSPKFAAATEDVYATKTLNVTGIHTYADANTILELVNEARTAQGLDPLILDGTLTELAMQRAAECAVRYSHDRPNDESCFTVMDGKLPAGAAAENIAYGYRNAAAVTDGWLNSPGHYANIMYEDFTHIGIGVAWVNGTPFWAQLFHSDAMDTESRDYSSETPSVFVRPVEVSESKINSVYSSDSGSITVSQSLPESSSLRFKVRYNYAGAPKTATVLPTAFTADPGKKLEIKSSEGTVVATVESANDGSGELIVRPKATGTGSIALPVYEGQTNPFTYTVTVTVEGPPPCSHSWEPATCNFPAVCNLCGEIKGAALGHDFAEGVCCRCGAADPDYEPEPTPAVTTRIAGSNRYKTSLAAADELKELLGVTKFENIIVASGEQFADALTGSYLAAVKNAPVLLVKPATVKSVQEYVKENLVSGGTVYILGGESAVPASMESGLSGLNVKRLGGSNRYETNLLILNEAGFSGDAVIICTGNNFADSLSASAVGLPIMLVKNGLTGAQKDYLKGTDGNFIIIGGTNAVSEKVEDQLLEMGSVTRLSGSNRYETSVMVAEMFFDRPERAVIAYGENFPDGLSGGPLAHACGAPLLLVRERRETNAADYLAQKGITGGYVLGGTTVLADKTVDRVFGVK